MLVPKKTESEASDWTPWHSQLSGRKGEAGKEMKAMREGREKRAAPSPPSPLSSQAGPLSQTEPRAYLRARDARRGGVLQKPSLSVPASLSLTFSRAPAEAHAFLPGGANALSGRHPHRVAPFPEVRGNAAQVAAEWNQIAPGCSATASTFRKGEKCRELSARWADSEELGAEL